MKAKNNLKNFPILKTDREAEHFVETADLSEYDFSQFVPVKFEFQKKSKRVQLRMPEGLLEKIKYMAKEKGMPYTRFIREILEERIAKAK